MAAPEIPNLLSLRGGLRGRRGGRGGRGGSSSVELPPPTSTSIHARKDKIVQQTDNDASISRLSAVTLGYLDDKFAGEFVVGRNTPRRQPIINRGTYVRTTAIDTLVKAFITSNSDRPKQIISLGAGTDTRYWRLRENNSHRNLLYHELDFPTVSTQKFNAFRSSHMLSPEDSSVILHNFEPDLNPETRQWGFFQSDAQQTDGYLFHPIDLRKMPARIDKLLTDVPTLLISECCLCYLQVTEAESVIQTFASLIPTLGIVLYEPTNPNDAFGRTMFSNLAVRDLYMPTVDKYPDLKGQAERLYQAGFVGAQSGADILWLWKNWIPVEEKERVAQLEMLDELEEWELLARHYTVIWAWREGDQNPEAFREWRDKCVGMIPYPKDTEKM